MASAGWPKVRPFSPPVHRRRGEDDDVEDLREDQGRDGEVDVAQPGREVGDEGGHRGGGHQAVEQGQPRGSAGLRRQKRSSRAVHAEPEEGRMPERDHAGVADQESDDIASRPQISTSVTKRRQNSGSTSGADDQQDDRTTANTDQKIE